MTQLSVTDLREKSFSVPMVKSVSMIIKMLCSLEDLKNQDCRSNEEIIDNVVDELKRTSLWGNVKIKFVCEQLLLVVKTSIRCTSISLYVAKCLSSTLQANTSRYCFNSCQLQVCKEIKFRIDSRSPS